jgi:uncharacterized protein (TIGR00299 family) protein
MVSGRPRPSPGCCREARARLTTAWFHCFSGISGDMALGSLIDAGADLEDVRAMVARVPLRGWDLRTEAVTRGGIAATRVVVEVQDDVVVRTHRHIVAMIEGANLPERVRARALGAFRLLASVEGRIHRRDVEDVHFHEVGGHDAVVDVVGVAAALELLGVEEITASAVATGTGTIRTAHGLLPNPSPATVELLAGAPTYGRDVGAELTTPTGAALLASMASGFGPMPPMRVSSVGYGAGSRELKELPNCVQVLVGERTGEDPGTGQPLVLLEANLDDVTGEVLAHTLSALLEAGALDAWLAPVVMKKGRPGHVLSALADPSLVPRLRQVMVEESGTLGVRAARLERWPVSREEFTVEVMGHQVRVKVTAGRVKPEQADAATVAAATGVPLREVLFMAEQEWRSRSWDRADE